MEITWEEYVDTIVDPLFNHLASGWFGACVELSEKFGIEPPSEGDCLMQFIGIWEDEEWVDWLPDNLANFLKLDVYCDGYSS